MQVLWIAFSASPSPHLSPCILPRLTEKRILSLTVSNLQIAEKTQNHTFAEETANTYDKGKKYERSDNNERNNLFQTR